MARGPVYLDVGLVDRFAEAISFGRMDGVPLGDIEFYRQTRNGLIFQMHGNPLLARNPLNAAVVKRV